MTTDPKRWTDTLHHKNIEVDDKRYELNHEKWINTIPKVKKKNSIFKYSFTIFFFILGIVFITIIKNETKVLQKEILDLKASINKYKYELHNSTLDHQVITSPENLSRLAKIYLDTELSPYKKSQIKKLNFQENTTINSSKKNNIIKDKNKKVQNKIKSEINKKKVELKKLKEMYSKPEDIPKVVKLKVSNKIKIAKQEIQNFYSDPKSSLEKNKEKVQKWAGLQLVKVFLGMPVIPGK